MNDKEAFDALRYPLPEHRTCDTCKYFRTGVMVKTRLCYHETLEHLSLCKGFMRKSLGKKSLKDISDGEISEEYWEWEHD